MLSSQQSKLAKEWLIIIIPTKVNLAFFTLCCIYNLFYFKKISFYKHTHTHYTSIYYISSFFNFPLFYFPWNTTAQKNNPWQLSLQKQAKKKTHSVHFFCTLTNFYCFIIPIYFCLSLHLKHTHTLQPKKINVKWQKIKHIHINSCKLNCALAACMNERL